MKITLILPDFCKYLEVSAKDYPVTKSVGMEVFMPNDGDEFDLANDKRVEEAHKKSDEMFERIGGENHE